MIVLGFDPGTASTGWGVIEQNGSKLRSLGHGCIVTSARDEIAGAPAQDLRGGTARARRATAPDAVAIEELFVNVNVKTALAVGQARGVIILAAGERDLAPAEYAPVAIKQAVTGLGPREQGPGAGDDEGHPRSVAHSAARSRRRCAGRGDHARAPQRLARARSRGAGHDRHPSRRRHGGRGASGRSSRSAASGFAVNASAGTLAALSHKLGEEAALHTHLHVREDALAALRLRQRTRARVLPRAHRRQRRRAEGRAGGAERLPGRPARAGGAAGRRQEAREHPRHRQEARPASHDRAQGQGRRRRRAGRRRGRAGRGRADAHVWRARRCRTWASRCTRPRKRYAARRPRPASRSSSSTRSRASRGEP